MSTEEYWNNPDPTLFWAYKAKNEIEIKRRKREINYQAWLSGLYIQFSVGSLFDDKAKYLEQPIDFEKEEREQIRLENMTEEERIQERNKKIENELKERFKAVSSQIEYINSKDEEEG